MLQQQLLLPQGRMCSTRVHRLQLPVRAFLRLGPLNAQDKARGYRTHAEAYLLHHLVTVPEAVGCHGAAFRVLQAAGGAPKPAALDLLRVVLDAGAQCGFNPCLSQEAVAALRVGALDWAQLCVLEDRLTRLAALAAEGEARRSDLELVRTQQGCLALCVRCFTRLSTIYPRGTTIPLLFAGAARASLLGPRRASRLARLRGRGRAADPPAAARCGAAAAVER